MKKIISLVMCIAMIVSMFTVLNVNSAAVNASDLMTISKTAVVDGKVTYTISLKSGLSFKGIINHVKYDPEVLTPIGAEICGVYGEGLTTYGDVAGEEGVYALSATTLNVWKSDKNPTLMKITFEVNPELGDYRPKSTVGFYCVEFNSTNSAHKIQHNKENPQLIKEVTSTTLNIIKVKSVETSDGGLKVTWEKTPGARGYIVYRANGNKWVEIDRIDDGNVTSYTDKKIAHYATGKYTLRALDDDGDRDSGIGNYLSARYIMSPSTFKASCIAGGIKLTWSGVSKATQYRIYRRTLNADDTKSGWTLIKKADSDDRSYNDKTGMKSNTNYEYCIRTVTNGGTSGIYRYAKFWFYAVPNVSISSALGGAKVSWSKIDGATSYRIYRRYTTKDSWKLIAKVDGTKSSYIDKTAPVVKTIYYTVRAYGENGAGGYVTDKKLNYVKTPTLKKIINDTSAIKLSWESIKGVKGYEVYRKEGSSTKWVKLGTTKSTLYTDKNVKAGVTYTYTIRSYTSNARSGYDSKGLVIKRLTIPKLSKLANTVEGMQLSWGKVSGAGSYNVYRKTSKTGWVLIDNVNATSYIDTTAASGTTYIYTVRAVSGSSLSYYNTKGLSLERLSTPELTDIENTNSGVKFSWAKVTGADSYNVYRKTKTSGWKLIGTSKSTSYVDKKAAEGTTYIYTARAVSGSAISYYDKAGLSIISE